MNISIRLQRDQDLNSIYLYKQVNFLLKWVLWSKDFYELGNLKLSVRPSTPGYDLEEFIMLLSLRIQYRRECSPIRSLRQNSRTLCPDDRNR
jgi:hypothetical protein